MSITSHLTTSSPHLRRSPAAVTLSARPPTLLHLRPSIAPSALPSRAVFVPSASAARSDVDGSPSVLDEGFDDGDGPTSVDLELIFSEEQFDRVISEARDRGEPVVVLWMANWCRKCIYLKPKLEKLAAVYHPRVKFYCVDVNTVPQKLVSRAGVTKMPTIQLWKNSEKKDEIIGGHKVWLVVEDVRNMIENED